MPLSPATLARVQAWQNAPFDAETQAEVAKMTATEKEDAFYKDLEFGTGGMRGVMGAGTNRINRYTLGAATQGFSNYLTQKHSDKKIRVALAHDSRHRSRELAQVVADVFSANGITVLLFEALRPTPVLSFAIRHHACQGGVVLTASHNPPKYNGYKVYGEDGGQVVSPADQEIIQAVRAIASPNEVKFQGKPALIQSLGAATDEAYFEQAVRLQYQPKLEEKRNLGIVFTPLHGTGITAVPELLRRAGFEKLTVVPEQAEPDGNFPTVKYPNPEEPEALDLALKLAHKNEAELVLANDPDADRVGLAVRDEAGVMQLLNGNQAAALLTAYVLEQQAAKGFENHAVIKTIVTSELLADIAKAHKLPCYDTLTGFKHIAALMGELEKKGEHFLVGGEESYGYLVGDAVRDKDGVSACLLFAEMAAWAKSQGMTLLDYLAQVYQKYGFYLEHLKSLTKEGQQGASEIQGILQHFRATPPASLAGEKLVKILDYKAQTQKELLTGEIVPLEGFPVSNVLQFFTEKGTKVSLRPSGTEPKIKFYFSLKGEYNTATSLRENLTALRTRLDAFETALLAAV